MANHYQAAENGNLVIFEVFIHLLLLQDSHSECLKCDLCVISDKYLSKMYQKWDKAYHMSYPIICIFYK
jgi:hypothetical protein